MQTKTTIQPLATLHASELALKTPPLAWLVDDLLPCAAAAILGGAPKSGKSFLALETCVAVATGTTCAGRFRVAQPAPVLLLAAEDPHPVVVERLHALAKARGRKLDALPIAVIVEPNVLLPSHLDRLAATIDRHRPGLLLLDPLIRLHRGDENSAQEMSIILDGLRGLARTTRATILLVHHARKAQGQVSNTAFRGSSDLAAFGDVNLLLRKVSDDGILQLAIEHRAAKSPVPYRFRLRVGEHDGAARFESIEPSSTETVPARILALLATTAAPISSDTLRKTIGVRKQTITDALHDLVARGLIRRAGRDGWITAGNSD